MKTILVLTTTGSKEQAELIAKELVTRRHAACVNILPIEQSVYRWQGEICQDSEFLLLAKTVAEKYSVVEAAIQEIHDYDQPEILSFDVARGEANYLQWIAGNVSTEPSTEPDSDPQP